MAIYRRDRSFDNILRDVIADELPFKYVRTLEVDLNNGQTINWDHNDLKGFDSVQQVLTLSEEIAENIVDIRIEVDFNDIESDVGDRVSSLLDKFNNDESNND